MMFISALSVPAVVMIIGLCLLVCALATRVLWSAWCERRQRLHSNHPDTQYLLDEWQHVQEERNRLMRAVANFDAVLRGADSDPARRARMRDEAESQRRRPT